LPEGAVARQNRVAPTGAIERSAAHGLLMGNRGVLHGADGELGSARWKHDHWVCCVLCFKGRRQPINAPGRYTQLFFLDEAVALAAGHRPCAECRRADFERFRAAWAKATGLAASEIRAARIDAALHPARLAPKRVQRRHEAVLGALPDGTMVLAPKGGPALVWMGVRPWSHEGYAAPLPVPRDTLVTVLTPEPVVAVLAAGYVPLVHPSAAAPLSAPAAPR